jgi:hypothetical protein
LPEEQPVPSAEELVKEFKRAKVADFLVHTSSLLASLGYGKLEPGARDLDQARLAIDALKALLPVLEGQVPPEALRDFNPVLANMQLAYASAVGEEPTEST